VPLRAPTSSKVPPRAPSTGCLARAVEGACPPSGKLLTKRKVDFVDVAHDPKAPSAPPPPPRASRDCRVWQAPELTKEDPATYVSAAGRGPLQPGWHTEVQPVCCAYKLATIHIDMFGIQKKASLPHFSF
jgi:hypothetical protein